MCMCVCIERERERERETETALLNTYDLLGLSVCYKSITVIFLTYMVTLGQTRASGTKRLFIHNRTEIDQ